MLRRPMLIAVLITEMVIMHKYVISVFLFPRVAVPSAVRCCTTIKNTSTAKRYNSGPLGEQLLAGAVKNGRFKKRQSQPAFAI